MFGGIVETMGVVGACRFEDDCKQLSISPRHCFDDLRVGDSVAVNGVCLTVTKVQRESFDCSVVPETLRLTNLGLLVPGSLVNLERALKANDRIGGHYVQGHVDGVGEIGRMERQGAAWLVTIHVPAALTKYLVTKGYVTLDGMSITLVEVGEDWFCVTFIPHTQEVTIVNGYAVGSKLNIEVDILGKYTEKLLGGVGKHAI